MSLSNYHLYDILSNIILDHNVSGTYFLLLRIRNNCKPRYLGTSSLNFILKAINNEHFHINKKDSIYRMKILASIILYLKWWFPLTILMEILLLFSLLYPIISSV